MISCIVKLTFKINQMNCAPLYTFLFADCAGNLRHPALAWHPKLGGMKPTVKQSKVATGV